MARANRYFLPGIVWHITHRCHKQEFLLKFGRDRKRWLRWLFEAKKRYGARILNYVVTSNHIHLLVQAEGGRDVLPKTMQLAAGRTAQEYNIRKNRKGAFWEDRYHATAVEQDSHLVQCMVYIDLNMVRAGVVRHPSEWPFCGYNEIHNPPDRYALIDRWRLMELLGIDDSEQLSASYKGWIERKLQENGVDRNPEWSESLAVGSKPFVEEIKENLGGRAIGREVVEQGGTFRLRESLVPYNGHFDPEMVPLSHQNSHIWQIYSDNSV